MKKNIKLLLIIVICIGVFSFLINPREREPADNLDIEELVGFDIFHISENDVKYEITREFSVFGENDKRYRKVDVTIDNTVGNTREVSQLKSDKEKVLGLIKVCMFSDSFATYGIRTQISTDFKDSDINDTSIFVVCKGKSLDILQHKVVESQTVGEFIEGQIKNHKGYDFFSDEYTSQDMFARLDSEGRNISIPYIEFKNDGIEIAGMALFKKDKMVAIADIKNGRIMNMLLNNNVRGVVTLYNNSKYIDFNTKTKRKVKCKKVDGKYSFVIDLSLNGDIATNTISEKSINSISEEKNFEKLMAESVKKQCNEFISKMKSEYKVDCLELGRVAAAKYGRRTGIDWDKVVMDSDIKVNVEVRLDKQGRGEY